MSYKLLSVSDFAKFEEIHDKGILELTLKSWDEFHDVVKIFNNNTDYIWRGQSDKKEWILNSTFDRKFPVANRKVEPKKILDNFKSKLKDLQQTVNLDFSRDFEIWAIGQHYNLPTPLLDWTKSPYVAAYFAFYKKSAEDGAIYALNRVVKRLIVKEKDSETKEVLAKKRKVEFDFDSSHFSWSHHARLIAQSGTFTKAYNGNDIKSVVEEFWLKDSREKKNYETKIILTKILVPNTFRCDCLNSLKSMGITHGRLFPDYAGAVDICKIDLGIDDCSSNTPKK